MPKVRIVNDPLYGNIHLTGAAVELLDTPALQRLRRIRQLGYAYLVYPSATHTRFEHPIGAYHLSGVVLERMRARGEIAPGDEESVELVRLAALLHDAGHFVSTHLLEEYDSGFDHEHAGERILTEGPVAEILANTRIPDAAKRIAKIIRHEGDNPLRTLVAGAVDVDRLDYMARDAFYCGLPIGFDQNRLLNSLTLATHPDSGQRTVMLYEKGINALDQMLWQRYNLYRNVYRHHACRSASVMGRHMLIRALETGLATFEEIFRWSDEEMFFLLRSRIAESGDERHVWIGEMAERLMNRRLYKLAGRAPLGSVPEVPARQLRRVERRLAEEFGVKEGEILIDVPYKPGMFEPDIYILRKNGDVVHRSDLTPEDGFVMNNVASSLYRAAGLVGAYAPEGVVIETDRLIATIVDALKEGE